MSCSSKGHSANEKRRATAKPFMADEPQESSTQDDLDDHRNKDVAAVCESAGDVEGDMPASVTTSRRRAKAKSRVKADTANKRSTETTTSTTIAEDDVDPHERAGDEDEEQVSFPLKKKAKKNKNKNKTTTGGAQPVVTRARHKRKRT